MVVYAECTDAHQDFGYELAVGICWIRAIWYGRGRESSWPCLKKLVSGGLKGVCWTSIGAVRQSCRGRGRGGGGLSTHVECNGQKKFTCGLVHLLPLGLLPADHH